MIFLKQNQIFRFSTQIFKTKTIPPRFSDLFNPKPDFFFSCITIPPRFSDFFNPKPDLKIPTRTHQHHHQNSEITNWYQNNKITKYKENNKSSTPPELSCFSNGDSNQTPTKIPMPNSQHEISLSLDLSLSEKTKIKKEKRRWTWIMDRDQFFNIKHHNPITTKSLSHSISLCLPSISWPDHQNPQIRFFSNP